MPALLRALPKRLTHAGRTRFKILAAPCHNSSICSVQPRTAYSRQKRRSQRRDVARPRHRLAARRWRALLQPEAAGAMVVRPAPTREALRPGYTRHRKKCRVEGFAAFKDVPEIKLKYARRRGMDLTNVYRHSDVSRLPEES